MTTAFQSTAFQNNAFQISVAVGNNVGGPISGGYFSKEKWHKVKEEIRREREQKRKRKKELVLQEQRELELTPLERAERDLLALEKLTQKLADALKENLTRDGYQEFVEADEKLTQLRARVNELRHAQLISEAKSKKAKERAEAEALRKSEAELRAQQLRQQEVINALAAAAHAAQAGDALAKAKIDVIAAHSAIKMMRDAQEDEEHALLLLMS